MAIFRTLLLFLLAAWLLPLGAGAQTVSNTATLTYASAGGDVAVPSNTIEFTRQRFTAKISFRRLPTNFEIDYSKLKCEPEAGLRFTPQAITADELARAAPLKSYNIDNPMLFVLESDGANHDPTKIETADLIGDSGQRKNLITLTETGPNTGVFAGAVPPSSRTAPVPDPCDITADHDGWLTLSIAETADSDGATSSLLVDPLGTVFNSLTGEPVDGAIVTLINDATGLPADVFGDDGISAYPSSVTTGSQVTDAGGWIYKLRRGNFRFPLVEAGRYRLVVQLPPGLTAPSGRTAEDMAALRDPDGARYVIVDGSYGRSFPVAGTAAITVDIPVDPLARTASVQLPLLIIDKQASVREAEPGDVVEYQIELRNTGPGAAVALSIADALPRGLRYHRGSAHGAAEPKISSDGARLDFALPPLAAGAATKITYLVDVAPGAPIGVAVNHAVAQAQDGAPSNDASAALRIHAPLMTDALTIIGRITEGDCRDPDRARKGVAGIRLLMEDGVSVVTDADGLYHFEGVAPGTHVVQIDSTSVPQSYAPVTCDRDTRAAKSAISRFVEGRGGSLQRVDFQLRPTGKIAARADVLPITPAAAAEAAGNRDDWLARAVPGIGWMFPAADHNPRAPAVRVVIRHGLEQRVALTLGGKPVDPLSFDGTERDRARGAAISVWTGLPLVEGDNLLEARVLDADGTAAETISRTVHYANTAAQAIYIPAQSRLVADGLSRPLIAVRVTDRAGRPVRAGTPVPFRVEQPHEAAQEIAAQQARQLAGLERTKAVAQVVGDDGLAFIALQPTRHAGLARIAVTLADRDGERTSEIKAWLATPAQKWVVVGYGKGTIGYDRLAGAERLAAGSRREIVSDGQLSLYAKGRIKGSWLLTLAYDSAKDAERMRDRGALGTIDPDRYYTVYGDGTAQSYDAASRRKLYLRLERREYYALYGDFETGLVDTKLTRYSRTMNGVKAEYTGNLVRFTAFGANDDSRYGRDEIQGNGLSGPYRLSARAIVPNSDKLRLETRERLRPDRIVESHVLTRHIDYDIDPDAGTIRFREPILSHDANLDPQFIVADYEVEGGSRKLAAGGRAAVTVHGVELGASLLHDETAGRGDVAGMDLRAHVASGTDVRAEIASGGAEGIDSGRAYLAEIEHHGPSIDLLAYARQQDLDFGLGQQNIGEAGTRKLGMDGRLKLGSRWAIASSGWYQLGLDDGRSRIAGDTRLEYRRPSGIVYAGMQLASDRTVDGDARSSTLVTLGGTRKLLGNRLELGGETQIPINDKEASADFPARQRLSAAWRFTDWLKLIGAYEVAKGSTFTAQTARIGFDVAPWTNARLLATVNQSGIGEYGPRTFAQYGMNQSLPIGRHWTIDATLDSSATLSGKIPQGDVINPFQPVASGGGAIGTDGLNGDFVATTLGATYRGELWTWNGRVEARTGSRERRWGITSNLLRSLGGGGTLASSLRAYQLREAGGAVATSIRADVALALRPVDSRWSLLERFQIRTEGADGATSARNPLAVPTFASSTRTTFRAVNNLAVNYRNGNEGSGHGFEASVYYGAKYVRGRYADERFAGVIDVIGIEVRKDITARFDLGAMASAQHSWSDHAAAFALGVSAGVSPAGNWWITAGYNFSGYRDRDFEDARWTRQGPYLTARLKFDQESLGGLGRSLLGGRR